MRIRNTVRLVEVDVIAEDKHGNPVKDLDAKDFTLLDNGKVQKITACDGGAGNTGQRGRLPPDPANTSAPSHAATFSNSHPENVAATVILFDVLNTPAEHQPLMAKELVKALNRLPPGTPIALLILGDDLTVVSDFTTSTISLADAAGQRLGIRGEGFGPPISVRASGNPIIDRMVTKAVERAFHADENDRASRTLAALNLIGEQLARIHGRKSLLWLTGGLNVTRDSWAVQTTIDKLSDADVAVYTVDTRGVVLDPGTSAENDSNDLAAPVTEEQETVRGDILAIVARNTGGVFYHNTNRLDGAITRAIEDRAVVYALDYYPHHDDWRGRFHKLEVKTSRAGVHLRYRSGYLATPPAQPSAQDQQQMLAAVASSPAGFLRDSFHRRDGYGPRREKSTPVGSYSIAGSAMGSARR